MYAEEEERKRFSFRFSDSEYLRITTKHLQRGSSSCTKNTYKKEEKKNKKKLKQRARKVNHIRLQIQIQIQIHSLILDYKQNTIVGSHSTYIHTIHIYIILSVSECVFVIMHVCVRYFMYYNFKNTGGASVHTYIQYVHSYFDSDSDSDSDFETKRF